MSHCRQNKKVFLLACALLGLLVLFGCRKDQAPLPAVQGTVAPVVIGVERTPSPSPVSTATPTPAPETLRYVFLLIGDGMGPNQVLAVNETLAAQGLPELGFTRDFPVKGEAITNNVDGDTTDSAAAATAIATGTKTENGILGLNLNEKRLTTIAERLKARGWGVGILTTVSLDHATPAGFYAHTAARSNYEDIIDDLFKSGFDYFAGGGFHGKADRTAAATKAGYTLLTDETAAAALPYEQRLILSGNTLMGDKGLPLAADPGNGRAGQLARLVGIGIERLSANGSFFLMAEGGRIDLAGHYHDPGDLYREVLDFDLAVAEAVAFYRAHPAETFVLVTADHETGGLILSDGDRTRLIHQTMSCDRFDQVYVSLYIELQTEFDAALPEICTAFGLTDLTAEETDALRIAYEHTVKADLSSAESKAQYGAYAPVTCVAADILSARAGLAFTTGGHTSTNVSVYALGVGDGAFTGVYENTEIHQKLLALIDSYGG